jgi:uncharacterized repeat protein (TIGR01451 family)
MLHLRSRPAGALAAVTAMALAAPGAALASPGATSAVSLSSAGVIGNDASNYPDMTPDGRFVSFASSASNLVAGDTNGFGDVFVRDRRSGTTERVSLGVKAAQGNGDSNVLGVASNTAISDDGRYVAFKSEASNLVRGDRNANTDVFVRDRAAGTTERVSVDNAGRELAGGGDAPAISPDGRYVAFVTRDIDTNFNSDVYLRDRVAGTTVRISVAAGGDTTNESDSPAVANGPSGALVAFASLSDGLVAGDADGQSDVFVRDVAAGTTERVSVNSAEQPGTGGVGNGARGPSISNDGRFVAFSSDASNFTPVAQTNLFMDVFVRDRQAGVTILASPSSSGGEADGPSEGASISSGGGFVSFASFASNLVVASGGEPLIQDTYVRDLAAATTERTSVASNGDNATFSGFDTHVGTGPVSADGLVSLIVTNADNLQAGDDNLNQDVFARDRRPGTDLALTMTDAPDPVAAKGTVTYTLTVSNQGASAAPGAAVVDTLPAGVTFSAASAGCSQAAGVVTCELGSVAAGASTAVTITVTTKARGTLTNAASVGANVGDPDASDNTATETTTVGR